MAAQLETMPDAPDAPEVPAPTGTLTRELVPGLPRSSMARVLDTPGAHTGFGVALLLLFTIIPLALSTRRRR